MASERDRRRARAFERTEDLLMGAFSDIDKNRRREALKQEAAQEKAFQTVQQLAGEGFAVDPETQEAVTQAFAEGRLTEGPFGGVSGLLEQVRSGGERTARFKQAEATKTAEKERARKIEGLNLGIKVGKEELEAQPSAKKLLEELGVPEFKATGGALGKNAEKLAKMKSMQFKDAQSLRKEYEGNPVTKASNVALPAAAKMEEAYNEAIKQRKLGKSPSAADLSLVFAFMKMLDPGSVVRESEYRSAAQTAGIIDQVMNLGNKIKEGDILTETQRENFIRLARKYAAIQAKAQGGLDTHFSGIASRNEFVLDDVIRPKQTLFTRKKKSGLDKTERRRRIEKNQEMLDTMTGGQPLHTNENDRLDEMAQLKAELGIK